MIQISVLAFLDFLQYLKHKHNIRIIVLLADTLSALSVSNVSGGLTLPRLSSD